MAVKSIVVIVETTLSVDVMEVIDDAVIVLVTVTGAAVIVTVCVV